MRVLISTVGSTGDLNPFLALGRALLGAGHEPMIFTNAFHQERIARAGVAYRDSKNPGTEASYEPMLRAVMAERNPMRQGAVIFEYGCNAMMSSVEAAQEAVAWADVVVAHSLDFAALAASETVGRPLLTAHLFPTLLRARAMNPTGRSLGRLGNAFVWTVAKRLSGWLSDRPINRLRSAFGLLPKRNALFALDDGARAVLLPVSPAVVAFDELWRGRVTMTGYWFLDELEVEPEPDLARFVEGGEPPVVVSFGSMAGVDGEAVTDVLVEALRRTGRRAVLQSGWARLGEGRDLPPNVHRAGYVPHAWLLPRASCLVHHGGAGTTAAAFRAGIPQVIVWHMGDQTYWGARVEALGVGPARLYHRKLTPRRLAERIDRVHRDGSTMAKRARELGERIAADDGLGLAIRAIEVNMRVK